MKHNARSFRWFTLAALTVAFLAAPPDAAAQDDSDDYEDDIHVVQKKPVLQAQRVELMPRIGMSINDNVYQSVKVGANANYHFSERAYVGGVFEWYNFRGVLGGRTRTFDTAYNTTRTAPDAPLLNWFAAAEVGFLPLYGKFALFNFAIVYWDMGATIGAGYANAESLTRGSGSGTFGATGSLVSRLYLNDWLGLNLELRDVLFPTTLGGAQGEVSAVGNIATVALGVSLYLPPSFEYSE